MIAEGRRNSMNQSKTRGSTQDSRVNQMIDQNLKNKLAEFNENQNYKFFDSRKMPFNKFKMSEGP